MVHISDVSHVKPLSKDYATQLIKSLCSEEKIFLHDTIYWHKTKPNEKQIFEGYILVSASACYQITNSASACYQITKVFTAVWTTKLVNDQDHYRWKLIW
jgi:hypothetical protein